MRIAHILSHVCMCFLCMYVCMCVHGCVVFLSICAFVLGVCMCVTGVGAFVCMDDYASAWVVPTMYTCTCVVRVVCV
jgi:hypothetical protein